MTEHDPDNADGFVLLGNALLGQKHYEDALAAFSKAIAVKPTDASAYLNRAYDLRVSEAGRQGRTDFQKAISVDPHALQAYANLAGFYYYKKDAKKAEEIYRQEIANNPDSPVPYLRLAGLMMQEGRRADADDMVQQLRTKQPTAADVAVAIGDFYIAARNPECRADRVSARPEFRSQKSAVADPGARNHARHRQDRRCYQKLTDRLLKENPGDITARITNGRLLAIKGNTADAIVVLREVVKDAPENPQAHYILGQVLRESKRHAGRQE